jgi:hypothetical protein
MSVICSRERIRIAVDASKQMSPLDALTGQTPDFWRGDDLQLELGLFWGTVLSDVSNIASLTVEFKPNANRTGTPLMAKTVYEFDTAVDGTSWSNESRQHVVVPFTATETALDMNGAVQMTLWCVIHALTKDEPARRIVWGAGPITISEPGIGGAAGPAPGDPLYYTAAESDARYLTKTEYILVRHQQTGRLHRVEVAGAPGEERLLIGPALVGVADTVRLYNAALGTYHELQIGGDAGEEKIMIGPGV